MTPTPPRRHPPVPPAPWHSSVDAVVWVQRAPPNRPAPPAAGAIGLPATVGGVVAYRSGPVGPYDEVFAAAMMVRRAALVGHVPFMAVDSEASLAGGRANWALPKVLARFGAAPGGGVRVTAADGAWALELLIRARTRRLPVRGALTCAQVWPDGSVREFTVAVRGQARTGSVVVADASGAEAATWLVRGRHAAAVFSGGQVVGPPRR